MHGRVRGVAVAQLRCSEAHFCAQVERALRVSVGFERELDGVVGLIECVSPLPLVASGLCDTRSRQLVDTRGACAALGTLGRAIARGVVPRAPRDLSFGVSFGRGVLAWVPTLGARLKRRLPASRVVPAGRTTVSYGERREVCG